MKMKGPNKKPLRQTLLQAQEDKSTRKDIKKQLPKLECKENK
jgi:hypothetical protein